jgi:hypothetical protein
MPKEHRWSNEEVIIAVYFSSRQICSRAIHCSLFRRGFRRTHRAIERKIYSIAKANPRLRFPKSYWDLDVVDRWIDGLLQDHKAVNECIDFSADDADDVVRVSCPGDLESMKLTIFP